MNALLALYLCLAPALAADLDGDGYDSSVDCDDQNASVHPGQPETCEEGDQVDNDCNGDVNSADGFTTLLNPLVDLYVDEDGDTYGDPDIGTVEACELVDGYAAGGQDCDDTDDAIYPGAGEVCDLKDQDCDGLIDEPELDPETSGCVAVHLDNDNDGYGYVNVSECLCLYGEETSATIDGDTYVQNSGDCYDYDSTIRPRSCDDGLDNDSDGLLDESDPDCAAGLTEDGTAPEDKIEIIDGHDNDCDGNIPAIELDCDDDGAIPMLPAGDLNNGAEYTTHADLGLTTCGSAAATVEVSCWGDTVRLTCDPQQVDGTGTVTGSGLWVLEYTASADGYGGRYDGGHREYGASRTVQAGDCDDLCAARAPGLAEACDGVDSDCSGADGSAESGGLPAAMTEGVAGTVSAAEADLDGDGALDCDSFSRDSAQEEAAPGTCEADYALEDCDDLDASVTEGCLEADTGEAEGTKEDSGGGCGSGSSSSALLLLPLLPMAMRRRRSI